jgi:DNA-binding MarR family transcriptional regulator
MTPNETLILTIIARELDKGRSAPSNNQICEVLGYSSTSSAAMTIDGLKAAGLIEVSYPNRTRRDMIVTEAGRRWLASRPPMHAPALREALPRQTSARDFRSNRGADQSPIGDAEERRHRSDAEASNRAFLAAMRRVQVPAEPPAKPERAFRQLPPPSLTAEACS